MITKYRTNNDTIEEFLTGSCVRGSNNNGTLSFACRGDQRVLLYNRKVLAVYDTFGSPLNRSVVCVKAEHLTDSEQHIVYMIRNFVIKKHIFPDGKDGGVLFIPMPEIFSSASVEGIRQEIISSANDYVDKVFAMMQRPAQYPMYLGVQDLVNNNIIYTLYSIQSFFNTTLQHKKINTSRLDYMLLCLNDPKYASNLKKVCVCHSEAENEFEELTRQIDHLIRTYGNEFIALLKDDEDVTKESAKALFRDKDFISSVIDTISSQCEFPEQSHAENVILLSLKKNLTKLLERAIKEIKRKSINDGSIAAVTAIDIECVKRTVSCAFREIILDKKDWYDYHFKQQVCAVDKFLCDCEARALETGDGIAFKDIDPYLGKDEVQKFKNVLKHNLPFHTL